MEELLRERQAPPDFYLAFQETGTDRWFHEADFPSKMIPDWEPLRIKVFKVVKHEADVKLAKGQLLCVKGPWGPIWV